MQLASIGQQETVNHLGDIGSPLSSNISPSKFMFQLDDSSDAPNLQCRPVSESIEREQTTFDIQQCSDTAMSLIASGLHNSDLIEITELPAKSLTNGQSNVVLTVKFPDNVKFAASKDKQAVQQNNLYSFQNDTSNQSDTSSCSSSMKENAVQNNQTKPPVPPSMVTVNTSKPSKKVTQLPDKGQSQV